MAGIIQILLYRGEEDLACLLTAFYSISLNLTMARVAIHLKYYKWLKYVWGFNKNYFGDN